ncbi:hypothetical protein [Tenacibaculum sp. SDUM215027]|uniref:hypothetical protein n=1 Tax=Tenacibaculum sp. SDUM215027 TaxID=3422596 RepID=UPI003D320B64
MKIVNSIAQIHSGLLEKNGVLKKRVDELVSSVKDPQWHYVSRVKKQESFALKMETCRVSNPEEMEDFFACTIVVENAGSINKAKKRIKKFFDFKYQRPKSDSFTHKDSSSFVFDDLRMYVSLKKEFGDKKPIDDIVFEIQIKTFLQHAWSIATHDLVYKSDKISWVKERVAYQVKAMLESAEVSIEQAGKLDVISGLPKENKRIKKQESVKRMLNKYFSEVFLPSDMIRLIDNIINLMGILDLELKDLESCLLEENKVNRGSKTVNLSPYLIFLQSIINQKEEVVVAFLKKDFSQVRGTYKIFLPKEVDVSKIREDVLRSNNVILV